MRLWGTPSAYRDVNRGLGLLGGDLPAPLRMKGYHFG